MSTGYERFHNEGDPPQVPPTYDEAVVAPSTAAPSTQEEHQQSVPGYQPQQPESLALQQPPTYQQPAQLSQQHQQQQIQPLQFIAPSQPAGTYVYEQQIVQPPVQQTIVHTVTNTPAPNDYFCLALFVCLCFCWPIGICALIKSNEVKTRFAAGDYEGAARASSETKRISIIGLVIGVVLGVISGVLGYISYR